MGALYKLQAKGWFSNMFNKMDFIMTFLFLAVLGSFIVFSAGNNGVSYDDANTALQLSKLNITMISSIVLMMVASSAINTFGISFFEMKDSVLLKRIGATEISKIQAVTAFILWGMTSMLFIVGWMAILIGICQIPAIAELTGGLLWVDGNTWLHANWAGVISSIIITMVSFYAIAFFFVSISKNSMSYQMIATFYFFLISFLGGAYTPNADLGWMTFISFMSPLGWGTDLMSASFAGANVFDWTGYVTPATISGGEDFVAAINSFVNDPIMDAPTGAPDASVLNVLDWMSGFTGTPMYDSSNADLVAKLGEMDFTQSMADSITAPYTAENISSFYAVGRFIFPVIYGVLGGAAAAKFFKWD